MPLKADIDAIDWKILRELQREGRITNVELSRRVGISAPPCLRRVKRLEEAGRYLLALDHDVVYVGEIGVGKTTAACRQAGLVIDAATASDLKGMMLDTGGGRTTLCDVRVETGERFALTVEPISDEEIYKLVAEVCRGVYEKLGSESSPSSAEFKPAEEVERALELAGEIHIVGERKLQRTAERDRDAGREGDRRIPGVGLENHPQRAAGAHRQMLVDRDLGRAV